MAGDQVPVKYNFILFPKKKYSFVKKSLYQNPFILKLEHLPRHIVNFYQFQ